MSGIEFLETPTGAPWAGLRRPHVRRCTPACQSNARYSRSLGGGEAAKPVLWAYAYVAWASASGGQTRCPARRP